MPVNQAQVASLIARPVPADLQCVIPQELADAIPQVIQVGGLASQISSPTGVTPVTNNTGQQALTLAQSLQTRINTLESERVQRRVVAQRAAAPTGNAEVPYTFNPAMPTAGYIVHLNFSAASGHVTIPKWRIKEGTQTTNSFTIIYDDLPAAVLITIVVEELKNVPSVTN